MNRLVEVLAVTIVVLVVFSGFLLYQNCDIVKITEFTVSGWAPMVCVTISSHANSTIENKGINDMTDLVLTLECLTVNDSRSLKIEVIHPREEIQIEQDVLWDLGSRSPTWVVTLSKGDKILDKRSASFSP